MPTWNIHVILMVHWCPRAVLGIGCLENIDLEPPAREYDI